jgi:hypothetical protein
MAKAGCIVVDINSGTKRCSKCGQEASLSLFFKHKQTSDGHHSWCKSCCTKGNERSRNKVNSTIEGRAKIFLRNAKNSAKKRSQEFSLSVQDVIDFWNKQQGVCAYSGRDMTLLSSQLNTVSIERIDSSIGYTKENTILVCQAINRMKSDFGFEDFYDLCSDVSRFLGDSNFKLIVGGWK